LPTCLTTAVNNMSGSEPAELDLYLASSSPRRRALLTQIGIKFAVIGGLDVDESPMAAETPEHYVYRLSRDKALAGYARVSSTAEDRPLCMPPILGADTCIAIDEEILGKPVDRNGGIAMLRRLSGRSHRVLTAVSLLGARRELQCLSQSIVTFKVLQQDEIERYWDSGEPADKAGAYAIQGVAARFVTNLQGSYTGVVGLPLYELSELLQNWHESATDDK
jgi:septum formation protein